MAYKSKYLLNHDHGEVKGFEALKIKNGIDQNDNRKWWAQNLPPAFAIALAIVLLILFR